MENGIAKTSPADRSGIHAAWQFKSTLPQFRKLNDRGHSPPGQRSVDMWIFPDSAFKVLINDPVRNPGTINLQEDQVADAAENPVGHLDYLITVRAMDKTFLIEPRGSVTTRPCRSARLRP